MCPLCLASVAATVTWIAAGAASTGGLAALIVGTLHASPRETTSLNQQNGGQHEHR